MNPAITVTAPAETISVEMAVPPAGEMLVAQAPPTPAEVQALEAAMAEQVHEADSAANLLGLWTSVALLHNLAVDHFGREEKQEEKKRGEPEA